MLAAVLATGKTIITNAACEPEIVDLANCLKLMGASIIGEGTSNISITGVPSLHGANYSVMPDRIELGTYACAAALTNGHLTFPNINKKILGLGTMQVLEELGIELEEKNEGLTARKSKVGLKAGNFTTGPFPSFATDMQPQLMAVSCFAAGKTQITETLFEKRFQHVPELQKMGAQIEIIDNTAFINGKSTLHGNSLLTSDIRAGAALVIAALAASGVTEIKGLHHLNRGYENLHGKLLAINAAVMRNII